jgi:hypothetical protein
VTKFTPARNVSEIDAGLKSETPSRISHASRAPVTIPVFPAKELAVSFPLSWSHYVRLLSVEDVTARQFYETEALRNGWSVRQLDRQIATTASKASHFSDRSCDRGLWHKSTQVLLNPAHAGASDR